MKKKILFCIFHQVIHSLSSISFPSLKLFAVNSRGTVEVVYRAKTQKNAPERYTAGFLYTDSQNSA